MFRIIFGLGLFCLLSLTSCSYYNYTYIQTPVSVPELAKRGDLKIQGSVNPKGVNAEVAYSPFEHLGILVNATSGFDQDVKGWEAGLGYYLQKNNYLFSTYGGMGYGDVVSKGESKEWYGIDTREWDNRSNYNKLYLQASLGYDFTDFFRLSYSVRGSYVMFDTYQYRYHKKDYTNQKSYIELHESFDTLQISSNASALIIDPAITATFFQNKRFSFTAQLGITFLKRYGDFLKPHTIDLSSYQPYTSSGRVSTASQSPATIQLRVFPISINVGARINISTHSK